MSHVIAVMAIWWIDGNLVRFIKDFTRTTRLPRLKFWWQSGSPLCHTRTTVLKSWWPSGRQLDSCWLFSSFGSPDCQIAIDSKERTTGEHFQRRVVPHE